MQYRRPKGSLVLPFGFLAVLALGAGGCSDATGALEQDVAQLQRDLNALTLSVHRSRGDTDTVVGQIDRRTREQSAEQSKQISSLSTRVDTLSTELTRVAARLDELSRRVESLSRELASRPSSPSPAPGGAPPSSTPAAPRPSTSGGPTPEQAYQAAYLDFSKGNYPLAIAGFREFVRRYPDAPLADQAQYWVGESLFSQARASLAAGQTDKANRELEQAVQEFRKLVLNYPRGERVPTALYKEALALLELKQTKLAQTRLQYLIDNFPQSEEAPLARERLATLGQSG